MTTLLIAAAVDGSARQVLGAALGVYLLAGFAIGLAEQHDLSLALALPFVVVASHIVYGIQFARGLLTRRLVR